MDFIDALIIVLAVIGVIGLLVVTSFLLLVGLLVFNIPMIVIGFICLIFLLTIMVYVNN